MKLAMWGALAGAGAMLMAGAAAAHEPYVLPNLFDVTGRDHVTIQGSWTEDLFSPDIAFKSPQWQVIGPDGAKTTLAPTYLRDLAVMEAATPVDGTYRLSSGRWAGDVYQAALVNGEWVFVEPGKTGPGGAKPEPMQAIAMADAYVSRGKPSDGALKPLGAELEIRPVTHPSAITAGRDAVFELLSEGKPLAGKTIELTAGDKRYGGPVIPAIKTGADGRFTFTAPKPGVYHAMATHTASPAAAGQPNRSLMSSLTFEAGD